MNNPLGYTDPTGHSRVEGCTERAGGCSVNQKVIDEDKRKENKFRQQTEYGQCMSGVDEHCSAGDKLMRALKDIEIPGNVKTGARTCEKSIPCAAKVTQSIINYIDETGKKMRQANGMEQLPYLNLGGRSSPWLLVRPPLPSILLMGSRKK